MSELKLKIRHAKRSNATKIDLSNEGLSEIPTDVFQLTSLESLNVSGNKLQHLRGIDKLVSLREILASRNQLMNLPEEIKFLNKLEKVAFEGNPVAASRPTLNSIQGFMAVQKEL